MDVTCEGAVRIESKDKLLVLVLAIVEHYADLSS